MPKRKGFNCSFDVKHVSVAQFLPNLQAKMSKIDYYIWVSNSLHHSLNQLLRNPPIPPPQSWRQLWINSRDLSKGYSRCASRVNSKWSEPPLTPSTVPIVENFYSSQTVEQKVMFTLCNDEVSKKLSNRHKVCTWVLLNTLLQFHEFFLTLCIL